MSREEKILFALATAGSFCAASIAYYFAPWLMTYIVVM
jgi:hypothetical protein